jgi:hypothetical protein
MQFTFGVSHTCAHEFTEIMFVPHFLDFVQTKFSLGLSTYIPHLLILSVSLFMLAIFFSFLLLSAGRLSTNKL